MGQHGEQSFAHSLKYEAKKKNQPLKKPSNAWVKAILNEYVGEFRTEHQSPARKTPRKKPTLPGKQKKGGSQQLKPWGRGTKHPTINREASATTTGERPKTTALAPAPPAPPRHRNPEGFAARSKRSRKNCGRTETGKQ